MDDLDRHIQEREKREPGFAKLVEAARARRAFMRRMATVRESKGLTQTQVAAKMNTSAAVVSRLESGADAQLSTLQKYMDAIGRKLFESIPAPRPASRGRSRSRTASAR